jgi:hypothetical protein
MTDEMYIYNFRLKSEREKITEAMGYREGKYKKWEGAD